MTLADIECLVTAHSPYPLLSIAEDHDAVILAIGPSDRDLRSTIAFSRLELAEANFPELMIAARIDEAAAGLDRFIASLTPSPKWDDMRFGP